MTWLNTVWTRHRKQTEARSESKRRQATPRRRKLQKLVEALEDRRVLASLLVNSAADNVAAGDGQVTLREAIIAANTDTATDLGDVGNLADTITFDPSLAGTPIVLAIGGAGENAAATGDLDISSDITIVGDASVGTTIDANLFGDRVFDVLSSTFTAQNLTITGANSGGFGGGGAPAVGAINVAFGATLSLESSTVRDNSIGGILNAGTANILASTISGNTSAGFGTAVGGLRNLSGGVLTAENSTISGNTNNGGAGGAISSAGTLELSNVTIANNFGQTGGGISNDGSADIANTILIGNTESSGSDPDYIQSISATKTDNGTNIVGDSGFFLAPNILGVPLTEVIESALADNGGLTLTHGLVPASHAVNAGTNADAPAAITDQRGIYRILNGTVDIGAVEGVGTLPELQGVAATSPIDEGSSSTLSGTVVSNGLDFASGLLNIDWGDGSSQQETVGPGGFSFTHLYNDDGTYGISITLDANNLSPNIADVGSATVVVNNVAPTADDDSAAVPVGQTVVIDVLDGDTDPAGAFDPLTITAVTNGVNGGIVTNNGVSVTYDPNGLPMGATDSFTYDISDGDGGTDTATVTVTIVETPSLIVTLTNDIVNNVDGETSLREAIDFANSNADHSTVTFDSSLNGQTISLSIAGESEDDNATGDLDVWESTTISGNSTLGTTIDASGFGDRILDAIQGDLTLENLTLTGGDRTGHDGGGVLIGASVNALIQRTTVINNVAENGAGIASLGALVVLDSTIDGNDSTGAGGGIWSTGGSLDVINSTISRNTAFGEGGGIASTQSTTITNATIFGNVANDGGGVSHSFASSTVNNTILVGNTDIAGVDADFSSFAATHSDNGTNVVGASTAFSAPNILGVNAADVINTTLANNGGLTQTHSLVGGSPAFNAGTDSDAVDHDLVALANDQRGSGFVRIENGAVDIGAFEVEFPEVSLSLSANAGTEDDQTMITVTATTSFPVFGDQSVDIDVSGVDIDNLDYTLSSVTIDISDGQSSGDVTFTVQDDSVVEALTETATISLTNPSARIFIGGNDSDTVEITDNDFLTPTIFTTDPDPTNSSPIPFFANFGQPVSSFTVSDIQVGNGSASNLLSEGGGLFSFDVTPSADGTVSVQLPQGAAQDSGGKDTNASSYTIESDRTNPMVSIAGPASPTNQDPFTATILFNEPVIGFDLGDISTVNASVLSLTPIVPDLVWAATIDPTANGAVSVQVGGGVATDYATNPNDPSNLFTVTVDTVLPQPVIIGPVGLTNQDPFDVTVNFGEVVTGFEAADVLTTNANVTGFHRQSGWLVPAADRSTFRRVGGA